MKVSARIGQVLQIACLTLAFALAFSGCAIVQGRAPSRLYGGGLVRVQDLDTSSLEGRRIVLDPGHGGAFPGAIGRGGLREADVNLGVALYLWGMLRDAGADVLMTRSSDVDFLGREKGDLRDDLTRRVDLALAFEPELFISLHHNADVFRSKKRNQTETYFKMSDDGPSRDLAEFINRRLTESLGIPKSEVVPGNYFVLRNMPCTAVLGEPSYLSNPPVEKKLRLAEKQLLEAQAYFLGILDYFSRGVPVVVSLSPRDTVVREALPALVAVLQSDESDLAASRYSIDTSSVTVNLDGLPVPRTVELRGELVKAMPEKPLATGRHEFCVSCRNLNGNSSAERCSHFEVVLPPSSLKVAASPNCTSPEGAVLITAVLTDANGNPVIDGTEIEFSGEYGAFSSDTVTTLAGIATSVFFPNYSSTGWRVKVSHSGFGNSLFLEDSVTLEPCGEPDEASTQAISVVADDTGDPLRNARLGTWSGDSVLGVSSPQGLIVFHPQASGGTILTAGGFLPAPVPAVKSVTPLDSDSAPERGRVISIVSRDLITIRMKSVASGVLQNAKIVIDAGRAPAGEERTELTDRNRALGEAQIQKEKPSTNVAERLKNMLIGAGAQVLVLGEAVPDEEKVRESELFSPRIYLRIERSSGKSSSLLHYPGSIAGTSLAQDIAFWCGKILKIKEPSAKEDAQYVLRQTSCPAVVAAFRAPGKHGGDSMSSMVAYALYLGILEDSGLRRDELAELTVTPVGTTPGQRDSSARQKLDIELDDFISLPAITGKGVVFFCDEGTHLVRARSIDGKIAQKLVSLRKGTQTTVDLILR